MTMKAPEVYEQLEKKLQNKGWGPLLQQMRQAVETAAAKENTPVVKRITKSKTQLYFAEMVERRMAGDKTSDGSALYGLASEIADALEGKKDEPKTTAKDGVAGEVREVVELGLALKGVVTQAQPEGFVGLNFDGEVIKGRLQRTPEGDTKVVEGATVLDVLRNLVEDK